MTSDSEKMLAEMFLRQERMMEEIRALRAQLEGHPAIADGWMTEKDAAIALRPEGIKSKKHLQNVRLNGAFRESKGEIQDVGKGKVPRWEYHVPNCRKALQRHFRRIRAV